jgi:hypothetical protein
MKILKSDSGDYSGVERIFIGVLISRLNHITPLRQAVDISIIKTGILHCEMATRANENDMERVNTSEKVQTEFVDTMIAPSPPSEEEAFEHMSWHTYAGLFVSCSSRIWKYI